MQNVPSLFQPATQNMKFIFIHFSYYIMLALFLLWVFISAKVLKAHLQPFSTQVRKHWKGALFCLLVSGFLFAVVPPDYRVLSDETNLVGVSKSMTFKKTVTNTTEGYWYYRTFYPENDGIEKRPLMFPFFASLAHTFTGYRHTNVFGVNFVFLVFIFLLTYLYFKKIAGSWAAYAAVLLLSSQPLISLCAASGGMDTMALLFFMIVFMSLGWYLAKPDADKLLFLWIQLLMFINVRYELIAIVAWIALALIVSGSIPWRYIRPYRPLYLLSPLLVLPYFLQRLLTWGDFELANNTVKPFAFDHMIRHTGNFLVTLIDVEMFLPYATAVNLTGVVGLLCFLWMFLGKKIVAEKMTRRATWILLSAMTLYWMIISSHHMGISDHPTQARFFMVFVTILTGFAAWLLSRQSWIKKYPAVFIGLALACMTLYLPVASENRFANTLLLIREYHFIEDFIKKQPDKNFLLVTNRPGMFTVENYGAITISRANKDREKIFSNLERKLFREVYVFQHIDYVTKAPSKGFELAKPFTLQPVAELQNTTKEKLRISRVVLPSQRAL